MSRRRRDETLQHRKERNRQRLRAAEKRRIAGLESRERAYAFEAHSSAPAFANVVEAMMRLFPRSWAKKLRMKRRREELAR